MFEGALTKDDIAKEAALVALVREVREVVRRHTDPTMVGFLRPMRAWLAVAYIGLNEAARSGASYAAITTMAYRAFRDQEERDVRRGG